MTEEEAVKIGLSKWWENATDEEIVKKQLYEQRLIMPFEIFHKALERELQRPI